jgi:hypothetical protein
MRRLNLECLFVSFVQKNCGSRPGARCGEGISGPWDRLARPMVVVLHTFSWLKFRG